MSNKPGCEVTDPSNEVLRSSAFLQNGPVKEVRSLEDLDRWVRSQAYHDTIAYINNTSKAIQGHRSTHSFPVTEQMRRLCEIFDGLEHLLAEHTPKLEGSAVTVPAAEVKSRSYRAWMQHMFQHVFSKLDQAVRAKCKHINELGQYLRRSFGNATSLDFGPANELMFLFFLCGLFRAGILMATDTVAAALMLFARYIHLVRRLVTTYALPIARDPKCSIDDYYFLPYLWGAAQLSVEAPFTPMQCEQGKLIECHRQDYMIVDLIDHLQKSRGGPLSQVAFQLWSILSIPTWPQVYRGLERNYVDHVLSSFKTVEHAIFCELMSFDAVSQQSQLERAFLGTRSVEGDDVELLPPVSRYVGMQTESVLGFEEDTPKEAKSDDSEGDRLWMLRQMVEDNDPNSTPFIPGQPVGQNDSVTSFLTEGP
ncbi:serine/threonine-protein phosphatase 2A activator [Drosophila ficusphila]|uniref:serine/threonine-protein phosphatase 2A activator n=1 Tax=Drosophila ficusphila TaxID=30025 RepID=UPI0007E6B764|nr:serine/threonine-protein phosphatase 2A activator [Drosophila ficusphila]